MGPAGGIDEDSGYQDWDWDRVSKCNEGIISSA